MREFLDFYGNRRYNQIMNRFNFSSVDQVDAFYDYIEFAVKKFFRQDSDYNNIAMGSLMQKSMNTSFVLLKEVLPLEITSRVLA